MRRRTLRHVSPHRPPIPLSQRARYAFDRSRGGVQVFVDDEEVLPETYWRTPSAFLGGDLLRRGARSFHLPPGGAVYFDGGVVEFVTPVIEIAPGCSTRAARSLWEQI